MALYTNFIIYIISGSVLLVIFLLIMDKYFSVFFMPGNF